MSSDTATHEVDRSLASQCSDEIVGASEVTGELSAHWQVREPTGAIVEFESDDDILDAVRSGLLLPDSEVRLFRSDSGEDVPWQLVSDELLDSSLALRALRRPIWSHSMNGAMIGGFAGAFLWLAQLLFSMFVFENWGAAAVLVYFVGIMAAPALAYVFSESAASSVSSVVSRGAIIGLIFALSAGKVPFGVLFEGVLQGLQMQLVGIIVGAFFGVPIGMAIGTCVGWARRGRGVETPFREVEGLGVLFKGFVAPLCFSALSIWVYFVWAVPWLISVIEG